MSDDIDGHDEGDLTPAERKRLRRMLQDDAYARRFKTTMKVWAVTLGAVATFIVAAKTIIGDFFR